MAPVWFVGDPAPKPSGSSHRSRPVLRTPTRGRGQPAAPSVPDVTPPLVETARFGRGWCGSLSPSPLWRGVLSLSCATEAFGLAADTPLCPAGHLPLKGGDPMERCFPSNRKRLRSGRSSGHSRISPLEGEMSGRTEGGTMMQTPVTLTTAPPASSRPWAAAESRCPAPRGLWSRRPRRKSPS